MVLAVISPPLLAWFRCHGRECVANVLEPADLSLYWGVDLPVPRVYPVYEQNMCGLGLVCELVFSIVHIADRCPVHVQSNSRQTLQ